MNAIYPQNETRVLLRILTILKPYYVNLATSVALSVPIPLTPHARSALTVTPCNQTLKLAKQLVHRDIRRLRGFAS